MTDHDVHTVETIKLDRGAGAAEGTDRDALIAARRAHAAALALVALVRCCVHGQHGEELGRGWRGPQHFSNNSRI